MEPNVIHTTNFIGSLKAHRYRSMLDYLSNINCENILEIGTHQGDTASELIKYSKNKNINYYGVDVFLEGWSEEIEKAEQSIKPNNLKTVEDKLKRITNNVYLFQGLSINVLPEIKKTGVKFDLIWIDGGHSYNTVKIDFENSIEMLIDGGVIFFDDYTTEPSYPPNNPIPLGVKPYIDDLIKENKYDIEILNDYVDEYRGHHYKIVRVKNKTK
jgi:predicted O-methyltransferase YrrM